MNSAAGIPQTTSATGVPGPGLLPHVQHNSAASSTSLRFWARSIGDRNPRFVKESYASSIGGSGFAAHPCWLYSVHDTVVDAGDPSLFPIIAGTDWSFFRPVLVGDSVSTQIRIVDERRLTGRFAGRSVLQRVEVQYRSPHGDPVATALTTLMRVSPEEARNQGRFKDWKRWKYTVEELTGIEADYDREVVDNGSPRFWEDVAPGEELPRIVRGPLTSEEMVLFVGATRPVPSVGAFASARSEGTAGGFFHPGFSTYETYAAGFVDDESARQLGFPAAHDYGIDRISHLASLVTNWIGDAGRLVSLHTRLLEPHMLGDTMWFNARVLRKEALSPKSGLVRLELWGANQRAQKTICGTASVELPLQNALREDEAVLVAGGWQRKFP